MIVILVEIVLNVFRPHQNRRHYACCSLLILFSCLQSFIITIIILKLACGEIQFEFSSLLCFRSFNFDSMDLTGSRSSHRLFFHVSAQWAFVLIFNNISPFCCCCCQHLCASYAFLLLWLLTVLYHRDWFSVKYTCVHVLWHCQSLAHRCSFWSFLLWIGLCVFVCMQSWFIRAVRCRCISHHWYLYIVIQIRERAECAYGWCLSQLR